MTFRHAMCAGAASLALLIASVPALGDDAPAKPEDPAVTAAKTRLAEAQKAEADAEKAAADAQAAAAKAKFGSLADYSNDGSVTASANAAKMEASVIAADAMNAVAKAIGARVAKYAICPNGKICYVVVATEGASLSFDVWSTFDTQAAGINREFDRAIPPPKAESAGQPAAPSKTPPPDGAESSAAVIGPAAVATGLAVVGNLLRSEYKVDPVDLAADDLLFAKTVIYQAQESTRTAGAVRFTIPQVGTLVPSQTTDTTYGVDKWIDTLDTKRTTAAGLLQKLSGKDGKTKKDSADEAAMTAAVKRYDDFMSKVSQADDKGVVPLAVAKNQAHLAKVLGEGYLLVVKENVIGGSAYSIKNFWTFFGGMPYSVTGGLVASYTLMKPDQGIVDSGYFSQTGKFQKVPAVNERYSTLVGTIQSPPAPPGAKMSPTPAN